MSDRFGAHAYCSNTHRRWNHPPAFLEESVGGKALLPSSGGQAHIKPECPTEAEFTHLFSIEAEALELQNPEFYSRVIRTKNTKVGLFRTESKETKEKARPL